MGTTTTIGDGVAAFALVLAACGGPPKPKPTFEDEPPVGPVGDATCGDVYGKVAELGASEDDRAIAQRDCVEDAWSDDTIACVMKAHSKQEALDCAAAEVRASALCTTLHDLIDAGATSPPFATIRGERTGDQFYLSTLQVPGGECRVDDFLAIVVCRMLQTDDVAVRDDHYVRLRAKVSSCLGEDVWAPALGFQMIKWVDAAGRQVSVRTEAADGTYGLFLYVGDPTDAED